MMMMNDDDGRVKNKDSYCRPSTIHRHRQSSSLFMSCCQFCRAKGLSIKINTVGGAAAAFLIADSSMT